MRRYFLPKALEMRLSATARGFESHSLRHQNLIMNRDFVTSSLGDNVAFDTQQTKLDN